LEEGNFLGNEKNCYFSLFKNSMSEFDIFDIKMDSSPLDIFIKIMLQLFLGTNP